MVYLNFLDSKCKKIYRKSYSCSGLLFQLTENIARFITLFFEKKLNKQEKNKGQDF